jgi:hypothetical protein
MITGSSGEEINILNSKISNVISYSTESKPKESEKKEEKKEKTIVKSKSKIDDAGQKRGNLKPKK